MLSIINIAQAAITAPALSANTTQICYEGTNIPLLNIVSGSGSTSYVSAAINDPSSAIADKGILFTATQNPTSFTITSDKPTVVPVANVSMTLINADQYVCKINPIAVGYATITIKANNGGSLSTAYTIKVAASAASAYASNTIFPTGISDASACEAVDENYMFVADDETNALRLYHRKQSGEALYSVDITSAAGGTAGEEFDIEGATKSSAAYNAGQRIYWIASLGNNKTGKLRPYRNRVIATDVSGTASDATLSVASYSDKMRDALITWGDNNSWNFTASAAAGVIPKRIDGFNVEGLTITNAGGSAYLGFRAPCVPIKGTTPSSSNRKYAVIAPVTNFEAMMNVSGKTTISPVVGKAILFDFAGLGIRSIERVGGTSYIIEAGLFEGGGIPKVYLWDGTIPTNSETTPITVGNYGLSLLPLDLSDLVQASSDGVVEGHPEGLIASKIGDNYLIQIICDNGTVDYYNDGSEAKALAYNEYKKVRLDTYLYSLTNSPALLLTAGTNSQTINQTSSISPIVYTWGGSANGVSVSGLPNGLSYTTNTLGKNIRISGSPTVSGTYNYTITTTQSSGTAVVLNGTITINTSVDEKSTSVIEFLQTENEIKILNSAIERINLYSMNGLLMYQSNNNTLDISTLKSGVYIVNAITESGTISAKKIIVN